MVLCYDKPAVSFLQTPGAMDVGVEVHSMSKGWNMIGWRLGWVCGNPLLVRAFADVKDNSDSGQFIAIQKAAVVALDNPAIPINTRNKYQRRLRKLVAMLKECGFQVKMPEGTYFLYTPAPKGMKGGVTFATAEAVSQYLITEQSICTVPWDNAGEFLRFSTTYIADDEAAEDLLMEKTKQRLQNLGLIF